MYFKFVCFIPDETRRIAGQNYKERVAHHDENQQSDQTRTKKSFHIGVSLLHRRLVLLLKPHERISAVKVHFGAVLAEGLGELQLRRATLRVEKEALVATLEVLIAALDAHKREGPKLQKEY